MSKRMKWTPEKKRRLMALREKGLIYTTLGEMMGVSRTAIGSHRGDFP